MSRAPSEIHVLLVEDEMIVAGMLRAMLATLDYAVTGPVSSIDEAMEIIDRSAIDAVVLDINLDGEMSYPVADRLAACGIPFIFATGYGIDSLPEGYRGFPLLKKPFRRQALADALKNLLREDESSGTPEKYFPRLVQAQRQRISNKA